jgi:hypothetical protein
MEIYVSGIVQLVFYIITGIKDRIVIRNDNDGQ